MHRSAQYDDGASIATFHAMPNTFPPPPIRGHRPNDSLGLGGKILSTREGDYENFIREGEEKPLPEYGKKIFSFFFCENRKRAKFSYIFFIFTQKSSTFLLFKQQGGGSFGNLPFPLPLPPMPPPPKKNTIHPLAQSIPYRQCDQAPWPVTSSQIYIPFGFFSPGACAGQWRPRRVRRALPPDLGLQVRQRLGPGRRTVGLLVSILHAYLGAESVPAVCIKGWG